MKPIVIAFYCVITLTACSTSTETVPTKIPSTQQSDGAPSVKRDVSLIPDAIPKPVKRTRAGNKSPYTVFGKTYTLMSESKGYREVGGASWYGTKFHGRRTANGDVYDMWGMTAAHKTLPIPSYVRVTNLANGKSVVVLVNDRGPFHSARIIDLSYGAATKLGFARQGVAQVEVVDVTPTAISAVTPLTPSVQPPTQSSQVVISSSPKQPTGTPQATTKAKVPLKTSTSVTKKATQQTYLQVAAFKTEHKATQLKERLATLLSTEVSIIPSADGQWFRVRVGPIAKAAQMSEARQILSEQGFQRPQEVSR